VIYSIVNVCKRSQRFLDG